MRDLDRKCASCPDCCDVLQFCEACEARNAARMMMQPGAAGAKRDLDEQMDDASKRARSEFAVEGADQVHARPLTRAEQTQNSRHSEQVCIAPSEPKPTSLPPQLQSPSLAAPGEVRICFPFLNRGFCNFGENCKYRHLAQDHPDAIADRVRTGHTGKINAPPEMVCTDPSSPNRQHPVRLFLLVAPDSPLTMPPPIPSPTHPMSQVSQVSPPPHPAAAAAR